MGTLLALFKDAGGVAWPIVAGGALGALVALAGLLALARRRDAALRLGVAAVVMGVLPATLGGLGAVHGRIEADEAVSRESASPVERQRLRRDGYLTARAPARLGLLCAALPLLAGVFVTFASARRRAREGAPADPDLPLLPRAPLRLPLGVALAGLLSSGFAVAALNEPVPGRNQRAGDTSRRILDHLDDIRRTGEGDVLLEACSGLEQEFERRRDAFDPGLLPALPAAVRRCVEARIQEAALLSSLGRVQSRLEALARSPLLERDAALQRLVQGNLDEVKRIAHAGDGAPEQPRQPQVRTAEVAVTGGLSAAVVQRVVRQGFDLFRRCYVDALRVDPRLSGQVTVHFTVGRTGALGTVSNGERDPLDADVVACVLRAFSGLSFPRPEGGSAAVTYTLDLSPAALDELVR